MRIALFLWAVVATVMAFVMGNNFKERAASMNALTAELTRYEVTHGCLGPEIDRFFWISACSTPATHQRWCIDKAVGLLADRKFTSGTIFCDSADAEPRIEPHQP